MTRTILILVLLATLPAPAAKRPRVQEQTAPASPRASASGSAQTVDGVAARIEDDILTESEVRELAAFQELVDGHPKTRSEVIRELADQWIVRGEANTAKFPRPSQADVDRAYAELVKQFKSPEEFQSRCSSAGLTEAGIRRLLEQQLYLSRFIDYRFRPSAQVTDQQVETYYRDEFSPQLKARGQPIPPLEDVDDTIREVLIQRAITDRATKWLDETRDHLKIDLETQGGAS
ncbi:MAG: hypothetical protein WB780_14505 [Candidatus Acidiferrales bacterium]